MRSPGTPITRLTMCLRSLSAGWRKMMMSPRCTSEYGSSGPSHVVRGARETLSAKGRSPICSVFSMEPEGITKACAVNVVKNRKRIAVTTIEEKFSRQTTGWLADPGLAGGVLSSWRRFDLDRIVGVTDSLAEMFETADSNASCAEDG